MGRNIRLIRRHAEKCKASAVARSRGNDTVPARGARTTHDDGLTPGSRSERQVRAPNRRSRPVFNPSEMASRLTCGFWPTSFRDLYTAEGKKSLRFVSHREWQCFWGGQSNARPGVTSNFSVGGVFGGGRNVSFVTTNPEVLSGAASSLSGIGDSMVARNAAAAAPTTSLAPAASDLVSAMTAAQFGKQGVAYQQLAAQAAEVHEQLVAALRSGAGAYALTEAANVAAAQV